jgi:hypothetical protein
MKRQIRKPYPHVANRQNGAALITALVVLIILTLLAISTLSTSTMEERMAFNSQEINRSFQTADSGITIIFADPDALNTVVPYTGTETVGTSTVNYDSVFRESVPIDRSSNLSQMWEAGKYSKYYFDLNSSSQTVSGITTEIEGGAFQISETN